MKKLIPLLMLLSGAVAGFSQGSVTFRNSTQSTTDPGTPDNAGNPGNVAGAHFVYDVGSPINSTTGVGLKGSQYVAELYSGTSASSLTPITASISRFRGTTTLNAGRWGNITLAGLNNDPTILPGSVATSTAFLKVVVWNYDLNGGAANVNNTFENATGPTGASGVFSYVVASPGDPPAKFVPEGLAGFALVPEPSAIALSVLGVAGLLFVRRRK